MEPWKVTDLKVGDSVYVIDGYYGRRRVLSLISLAIVIKKTKNSVTVAFNGETERYTLYNKLWGTGHDLFSNRFHRLASVEEGRKLEAEHLERMRFDQLITKSNIAKTINTMETFLVNRQDITADDLRKMLEEMEYTTKTLRSGLKSD